MFLLRRLGDKLGFYKDCKGVIHLDISWPSILKYAEDSLPTTPQQVAVQIEDTGQPLNFENLRDLLKEYGKRAFKKDSKRAFKKDSNGAEDHRFSDLTENKIEELAKICVARNANRLFNLEHLSQEEEAKFMQMLHEMLGNSTGFQRIMTLLAMSIINNCKEHAFCYGYTSITVTFIPERYDETDPNYESFKQGNAMFAHGNMLHLQLKSTSTSDYLVHESTHAFYRMLYGHADVIFNGAYHNFSIMNATDADFSKIFYPMLSSGMIHNAVHENLHLFKQYRDFKQSILKACAVLIRNGFGSTVFSGTSTDLSIDSLVNDQRLIVDIVSTYVAVWNEATSSTYWSNGDEILTIIGLLPISVDRPIAKASITRPESKNKRTETFVIENRQNELIHLMRVGASKWSNALKSEIDLQNYYFRRHAFGIGKDTDTELKIWLNFALKMLFDLPKGVYPIAMRRTFLSNDAASTKPLDLLFQNLDSEPTQKGYIKLDEPPILSDALSIQKSTPEGRFFAIENGDNCNTCDNPLCRDGTLDDGTPCQWCCDLQHAMKFSKLNSIDEIRILAAVKHGNWQSFADIVNTREFDKLGECVDRKNIALQVGLYGWEYAKELIAKNISLQDKMFLYAYPLARNSEVTTQILENKDILPESALAIILGGILRMPSINVATMHSISQNQIPYIEKIVDCLCNANIDVTTKTNAVRVVENLFDATFLDYFFVSCSHNHVKYNESELNTLLAKLFSFFPFDYEVSWENNVLLCQKGLENFSLLSYLPYDKSTLFESLMNNLQEFDPQGAMPIIAQDGQPAAHPAFEGFTLLHYAASLNEPILLRQIVARIDSLPENMRTEMAHILAKRGTRWRHQTAFDIATKFNRVESLLLLCRIFAKVFDSITNTEKIEYYDLLIKKQLDDTRSDINIRNAIETEMADVEQKIQKLPIRNPS
jgi:hypothetical protein